MLVVAHVNVPLPGVMVRLGGAVLLSTIVVVTLLQPPALATVTEYVPDALMTAVPAEAFWLTTPPPPARAKV